MSHRIWLPLALALACCIPAWAQPVNDNCVDALPAVLGLNAFDTTGATEEVGDPLGTCWGGTTTNENIWFTFTPPGDGTYTIETCGAGDTHIAIYASTAVCGSITDLDELACSEDACPGFASQMSATLVGAETYLIQISGWTAGVGYSGDLNIYVPGDSCDSALPIDLGVAAAFDTAGFSDSLEPSAGCWFGSALNDVWWTFTPPLDGDYQVSTCAAGGDTQLALYSGACGALVEEGCSDDDCGLSSSIVWTAVGGSTYYIRAAGWGADVASEVLVETLATIPDTCDTAEVISIATPVAFDTSLAVDEGNAGSCFFTAPGGGVVDIWYSVTAVSDSPYIATTCGAGGDTQIAVYEGDCALGLTELACGDDTAGCGLSTEVTWDAITGTTYYVQVSGWGSGTVSSTLTVFDSSTQPPDNDICDNAFPLGAGCPQDFDTTFATDSGIAGSCGGGTDVWYSFSAWADGDYTVDTCAGTDDTILTVWTGGCGTLTEVGCNDDTCGLASSVTVVGALAGDTYYVQITGWGGGVAASTVSLTGPAGGVPNDTLATAEVIALGVDTPVDTTLATNEGNGGSCFFGGTVLDVWYTFDATTDGEHIASTCAGGGDTQIAVYGPGGCSDERGCSDDDCGLSTEVIWAGTAGETYYIQVSGWGSSGTVTSSLLVDLNYPTNDACADAIPVSGGSVVDFTTQLATADGVNPGCGGSTDPLDIWYSYFAGCEGDITFSLCGSLFDTRIAVWDGSVACPVAGDVSLACNDDSCGLQSEVTVTVAAGDQLYIQVGGFSGSSGIGTLTVTEALITPTNDTCGGALLIADGATTWTNICNTQSGINPGCGSTFTDPFDAWFQYTASCDGFLTVDTEGTPSGDTRLAIWDGTACPVAGDVPIECDDDGGSGLLSSITIPVTAGDTFFIQAGGFAGGLVDPAAQLNVSCVDPSTADLLLLDWNSNAHTFATAATNLGLTAFTATNGADFETFLTDPTISWPMAVIDNPSNSIATSTATAVADYITGGGKAVLSYWNLDSSPELQAAFGVASTVDIFAPDQVDATDPTHPIWDGPSGTFTSIPVGIDGWFDNGDDMTAVDPAGSIGVFTTSGADAIIVANADSSVVYGWSGDDMDATVAVPVAENTLQFLGGPIGTNFVRGDANSDALVDIGDPVYILSALFVIGSPAVSCIDAGDVNDDGLFDIGDPVYLLSALFVIGSPPVPAPWPDCGLDPTDDPLGSGGDLGCDEYLPCL